MDRDRRKAVEHRTREGGHTGGKAGGLKPGGMGAGRRQKGRQGMTQKARISHKGHGVPQIIMETGPQPKPQNSRKRAPV